MSVKKFRPYFSPEELKEVISALKESPTPARIELIKYLEHYSLKISHGIMSPAISLAPSMADQLELSDTSTQTNPARLSSLRLQAFLKWEKSPSSCSPKELLMANEYRFENDLMSPEESEAYINKLMG